MDHPASLGADGAADRKSLRQSSSFEGRRRRRTTSRLVRFTSSHNLQDTDDKHDHYNTLPSAYHHLHRDTPSAIFMNPFNPSEMMDSRRTSASSSPDTSTYMRPSAFAGHRDTLARLQKTATISEDVKEDDSRSSCSSGLSAVAIPHTFSGHRDTFARIHFALRVKPYIRNTVIDRLLYYIPFQDYLNLRLTCRQWDRALPQPSMPGSYRVPREILQIIYSFLAPCDFDAARHTCRKWFDAGLDLHLLRSMLRAAQCQNAFKADLRRRHDLQSRSDGHLPISSSATQEDHAIFAVPPGLPEGAMSEEWLMSKRIATATRLSVDWRGPWVSDDSSQAQSRFNLIERVNFRRILLGIGSSDSSNDGKTFTLSTCGKYLLVMSGHDVFVYGLGDSSDSMMAVVRLAADRDVLRVSMDTSSGRYAVAALLDNRTGVLWDLNDDRQPGQSHFHSGEPMSLGMSTVLHGPRVQDRIETLMGHLPLRRGELTSRIALESYGRVARNAGTLSQPNPSSFDPEATTEIQKPFFEALTSFCSTPESEIDQAGQNTGIAIQTRSSATYYNLGSPDDAPRSVAICPSRKCVAFGCRHGIELHWVDALTGGDLNRWFPLAAPSDHLYFLPQRLGLDSSKKLRLISSAAGPSAPPVSRSGSLPARLKLRTKTHDRGRRQSMTRLFFGSLPFPSSAVFPNGWRNDNMPSDEDRQGVLRTVDCDHYQAVPLSDGYHMLYTDPASGQLCLGSDAPIGGPTKLIRKAIFVPPTVGDVAQAGLMSCYNAGQDLRWGVRIVAAHRDGRLILYNVPADVFTYLRHLRSSADVWDEGAGVLAQSDLLMDDVLSAHPNTLTDPMRGNGASRTESETSTPLRTVQIEGVEIGHVGRDIVDDVAVDTSNGGVRVWVFCRSGLAKLLDIYMPTDQRVRQRFVGNDGLLYDAPGPSAQEDEDGRRSPKGKEKAHSDDEDASDSMKRVRPMGFDGALEKRDDPMVVVETSSPEIVNCSVCGTAQPPGPEKLHVEVLSSPVPGSEGERNDPLEIEILTDWLDECLFAPYVVILD